MGVGICAGLVVGVDGCGQRWAKAGKSGWVRLIRWGWMTWLADGGWYACRSRGGCGWVWGVHCLVTPKVLIFYHSRMQKMALLSDMIIF